MQQPNLALDRPTITLDRPSLAASPYLSMTPKEIFRYAQLASPVPQTPATAKGGVKP